MNKKILGTFMAMIAILVIGMTTNTEAAVNWITPATDNIGLTGSTYNLSVTITTLDVWNVTFEYKTSGGTWTLIAADANNSADDTCFSTLWDTTALTDQASVALNASIRFYNTTVGNANGTFTHFDIDNTLPTVYFGTNTPANTYETGNTTIAFDTASDASVKNCTLTTSPDLNGTSSFFDSASSNVCEVVVTIDNEGTYDYYWTLRDNLNTSMSSTRSLTIDTSEGVYIPPEDDGIVGKPEKADTKTIVIGITVLVIIGLWYSSKK